MCRVAAMTLASVITYCVLAVRGALCVVAQGRWHRSHVILLTSEVMLWFRIHLYYIVNEHALFYPLDRSS
jgi:hypothetical protein